MFIWFLDDVDGKVYDIIGENFKFKGQCTHKHWFVVIQPTGYKE